MLEPEPFKESLGHPVTIPRASEGYTTESPAFEEIARLRWTAKAGRALRTVVGATPMRSFGYEYHRSGSSKKVWTVVGRQIFQAPLNRPGTTVAYPSISKHSTPVARGREIAQH